MNERDSKAIMLRAGWRFFASVAPWALMLAVMGGPTRLLAQSPTSNPVPAAQANVAKDAPDRATRGWHREGIQVHGYWTIQVSNPDGKVVKHVEFENSLAPYTGGSLLMAVLLGQSSPGSWSIGLALPSGAASGLCNTPWQIAALILSLNSCILASPTGQYLPPCTSANGCFPSLTVTPPTLTTSNSTITVSGITLTGQMTAEVSGTIGGVVSMLETCGGSTTPGACPSIAIDPNNPTFSPILTQLIQYLAGSNPQLNVALETQFAFGVPLTSTTFGTAGNCGGNGQPACQIPVVAGQLVSASVVISFQ
jgi:hypothetical protein